jgi:hypothetical protein
MALKLAYTNKTADLISDGGTNAVVGNQTITAVATLKPDPILHPRRMLKVHVRSSSGGWPSDVRVSRIAFRPEAAGNYFDFINIDSNGSVSNTYGSRASNIYFKSVIDGYELQLCLTAESKKPLTVGVFLVDQSGKEYVFGVYPVSE